MKKTIKNITILIPCYNEEHGVGAVISAFKSDSLKKRGFDVKLVVIDNNSKDKTAEVAKAHGAEVIFEKKKGKGNAIRSGFANISNDTDYVVMIDGDHTYRPKEVLRLIEPLESGFSTVVLGSRLYGNKSEGSMKGFNMLGNHLFTFLVRSLYRVPVTDVLTGYYAWKNSAIANLLPHLKSEGFTIEIEMITKMAKLGEQICSVPISYDKRAGSSNLRPVADGIQILLVLIQNIFWRPRAVPVSVRHQNELMKIKVQEA